MTARIQKAGFSLAETDTLEIFWTPHPKDIEQCKKFGQRLAAGYKTE
ncbi:MAG: hypothetical protein M1552_07710 [Firmicutes bacterium]|nr:hypothetical protein [Bacillota bacterium]